MKFIAIFIAFLAVQGWTSAATIPEIPDDLLELIESVDLTDLELFGELLPKDIFDEFHASAGNPKNCLPIVPQAYKTATEARTIVHKARELAKKLKEAFQKCKALSTIDEKRKCYQELKKQALAQGKPLKDAYLQVRPKVIDMMAQFDKCMANPQEVAVPVDAEKCLPHIQEAYDTAVQVRTLIQNARELVKNLKEALKTCRAMSKPEEKKACFQEVKKGVIAKGKPIKDAYLKIRPQIFGVMDKFDKCMA